MSQDCGIKDEKIFLKLAESFSEISGYEGWMIARLEYRIDPLNMVLDKELIKRETEVFCIERKHKRNYAVLEASVCETGRKYVLYLQLMYPEEREHRSRKQNATVKIEDESYVEHSFSRQEVISFAEKTNDYNPIHQLDRPVVPGLLLLEDVLEKIVDYQTIKVKMIFRNPLYAGQVQSVYQDELNQNHHIGGIKEDSFVKVIWELQCE